MTARHAMDRLSNVESLLRDVVAFLEESEAQDRHGKGLAAAAELAHKTRSLKAKIATMGARDG